MPICSSFDGAAGRSDASNALFPVAWSGLDAFSGSSRAPSSTHRAVETNSGHLPGKVLPLLDDQVLLTLGRGPVDCRLDSHSGLLVEISDAAGCGTLSERAAALCRLVRTDKDRARNRPSIRITLLSGLIRANEDRGRYRSSRIATLRRLRTTWGNAASAWIPLRRLRTTTALAKNGLDEVDSSCRERVLRPRPSNRGHLPTESMSVKDRGELDQVRGTRTHAGIGVEHLLAPDFVQVGVTTSCSAPGAPSSSCELSTGLLDWDALPARDARGDVLEAGMRARH